MTDNIAIKVSHVYKNFVLPHERANSIKGLFTGTFKKDKQKQTSSGNEIQHALKDINFEVKSGEFFGIVGRNGSGKSTLLKILAQIYQPTRGEVVTRGKLVPFIELGVGFNPELTGRENVFLNGAMLGFTEKQVADMYDEIVEFAELERFMDQKLKNYSSGMQVRLAFSMATRAKADVLLVDEVLAVGDAAFQRKCFEYFKNLKAMKKTVVFVTHDMNAVREYCDRAMLIDKSEIMIIGDPQDVAREYALLFMDEKSKSLGGDSKRWGNGDVMFSKVKAVIEGDNLRVSAKAKVNVQADKVIYGLHVIGQDGVEITAVNNRMIQVPDVICPPAGSVIDFEWTMLNVFNDGNYRVTLTLVDSIGTTYDWHTEAASFTVRRTERSTTSVLPPISVKTDIKAKG
jgi:ABC-2 type transport system ATP-binding protein